MTWPSFFSLASHQLLVVIIIICITSSSCCLYSPSLLLISFTAFLTFAANEGFLLHLLTTSPILLIQQDSLSLSFSLGMNGVSVFNDDQDVQNSNQEEQVIFRWWLWKRETSSLSSSSSSETSLSSSSSSHFLTSYATNFSMREKLKK